jgi:spore coat protein A
MHFHLVNCQVINRQLFDPNTFDPTTTPPTINFTSGVMGPDKNEQGYKETVKMYPGTVTRIIMKFDVPKIKDANGNLITTDNRGHNAVNIINGNAPPSPKTGGNEYVWHCHILEHEEHDMMHTLNVK